ncbi:MAG TPA: MBL fold metallo-hydrolase [Planctomycetota bacterium]|nr:MBL fold metallo-hydrolase [Planctomycetota bacterium]HRT94566.1 MBL fold metallo-hydrolase [Planctomycetota bacterium]
MNLIIHRGTKEIGGSCVELRAQGKSLILDLGMPLVNKDGSPFDETEAKGTAADLVAKGILPDVPGLYGDGPCNVVGVVLSHAHADHYGLAHHVRPDVPVFASEGTKALLDVGQIFLPNAGETRNLQVVPRTKMWKPVDIGPFVVRLHPVDHSAPDAVAIEVVGERKKVFYSGDLRGTGWKKKLFYHLLDHPPRHVDAMLMEGSSLGRKEGKYGCPDEPAVERAIIEEIKGSDNLALLFCSGQNVDRIVTAYKAAKLTGRQLVIGLYEAYVLDQLRFLSDKLPQYAWPDIRVRFWGHQMRSLREHGHGDFIEAVRATRHGITEEGIVTRRGKVLMLARANKYLPTITRKLPSLDGLRLVWSMWNGYLKRNSENPFKAFCAGRDLTWREIHASGHASIEDLRRLVQAVQPRWLVPIHTFHHDEYGQFGVPVRQVKDGEALVL